MHGELWAQGATFGRVGPLNNQVKTAVGPIGPDHADLLRWVLIFKHTYTNPLANCLASCGLRGPLSSKRTDELLFSARALVARMKEELVTSPEGPVTRVLAGIDVNKQPKNFRDAMSREDRQEWSEAFDSEYQGFLEHRTLKIVQLKPGDKILGTTTRTEYKWSTGSSRSARCGCVSWESNRKRECIINWENCMLQ